MKIYTRTGDDGTTGLLGPGRVGKHEPRVEAYGAGGRAERLARSLHARSTPRTGSTRSSATIQSRLFNLGAELATVEPEALAKLEAQSRTRT
jgi:cob(I)alamin adenosyltransferase